MFRPGGDDDDGSIPRSARRKISFNGRPSKVISRNTTTRLLHRYPIDFPPSKILLQTCQTAEDLCTPVTEALGLWASPVPRLEENCKEEDMGSKDLWEDILRLSLEEVNHDRQLVTRAPNKEDRGGKVGPSRGGCLRGSHCAYGFSSYFSLGESVPPSFLVHSTLAGVYHQ